MSLAGAAVGLAIAIVVGGFLTRWRGLPLDGARAVRWGAALLCCSIAFAWARESGARLPPHGPEVTLGDLLGLAAYATFAVAGYRWLSRRLGWERVEPRRLVERRRALPLPPPPAPTPPEQPEPPPEP